MSQMPHSIPLSTAQFFLTRVQELLDVPQTDVAQVLIERLCAHYEAPFACIHLHDRKLEAAIPGCHRRCPLAEVQALSNLGGVLYALLKRHQLTRDLHHRDEIISAFARSVEVKDPYTGQHLERVRLFARRLAQALGLPPEEADAVDRAALLHDVGKIGVPDAVLTKDGPLDETEWEMMKRHPLIGASIFQDAWDAAMRRALPGIRWHHERPDGRGYPDGLAGEDIPLIARIIAVANAYDALTSDRPYRKGMDTDDALQVLQAQAGAQFCPTVVYRFIAAECYKGKEPHHAVL